MIWRAFVMVCSLLAVVVCVALMRYDLGDH